MGNLKLNQDGIRLEGIGEFLLPLYVNEIQSRGVSSSLFLTHFQLACWSILWLWGTANKYHWLKHMWKALGGQRRLQSRRRARIDLPLLRKLWSIHYQQRPTFLWAQTWRRIRDALHARLHLKRKRKGNDCPRFSLCITPFLFGVAHFLLSSDDLLSGPPIGRRLVIGCFSAPLRPHATYRRLQTITGGPECPCWISNQAHAINPPPHFPLPAPLPPPPSSPLMFSRLTNTAPAQSWSKCSSPTRITDAQLDHPLFQWLGMVQKAISSTVG